MLGVLEAKVLDVKLPAGILVRADQLAREKLGKGLLDEALRFVMGRLPLANTAESLGLARDLVELLSDRMLMAKKTAQVESALLSAEDEARFMPRIGAASLQLSLFEMAARLRVRRRTMGPVHLQRILRRRRNTPSSGVYWIRRGGFQRPAVRRKGRHRLTRRHRPAMLKRGSKSSSRPSRQSPKRNLIRRRLRKAMPKLSSATVNRLL